MSEDKEPKFNVLENVVLNIIAAIIVIIIIVFGRFISDLLHLPKP